MKTPDDRHRPYAGAPLKTAVFATMLVASLGLAACATVGPDYIAPVPPPATLTPATAPVFSNHAAVTQWWAQFDDPTLDMLVSRALADNRDLQLAISRVQQARAVFSERRLDQAPHVTAGTAYTREQAPDATQDGQRVLTESYQLGFDASWELDLFGRKQRATEAARAALGAEQATLADAQVTVAAEVARNYFELRGIQKRVQVAGQTLQNVRRTQQLTEARWQLGAGDALDVESSRARLKAIEATVPLLDIAETQARNRLAVLLGLPPEALGDLLAPRQVAAFAKPLPLGDTRLLLRNRADVRAAERRLAAATAQVGVATADLFPRLSIRGFIGFLGGDVGGLLKAGNRAWSVAPSLSWAAFDYGSVRTRLRASEAQADATLAQYQQAVLLALEDADNSLTRYARQQSRLLAVAEQAQAARRAAELADVRYREGSSDFLTLLDAQRNQLAADDALATAESEVNVSVVGVYKALGGGVVPAPAAEGYAAR